MSRSDVVAHCEAVTRVFRSATGEVAALRGIDLRLSAGTVTGIVGPSGSGKSTLLGLLSATDRPTSGDVVVDGTSITAATPRTRRRLRRQRIGIVRQRPSDNLHPALDVRAHLRRAAALRGGSVDVMQHLASVGLEARARQRPSQLSGGEQQRLAIAVARVGDPPMIVADEPTGELDRSTGKDVIDLLVAAARDGAAVVISTHDNATADSCDRVVHLHHGAIRGQSRGGGRLLATIDGAGRLQLPPETWPWFVDGLAALEVGDRTITLRPEADG